MRRSALFAPLFFATLALGQKPADKPGAATPAEELTVAPGFKVELLKSASKEEGSWISMAIDGKGRLYISCQGKPEGSGFKKTDTWGGLYRVTLDAKGQIASWEKINVPVGDSMGMLWAFDSLYVSGDGPEGRGIYRLKDSDGNDQLDAWTLFKKVQGGNGEHGAHALRLAPDGKSIYIVHGNSTPLIEGVDPAKSPFRNYAEDDLLTRVKDPVATFFDKLKSPYGYILRTDENGTKWDLIAGGFRNPYDIDFNADGELFTYDSDMEWDVGSPWYRPTRVLHIVPGAEYGFREGSSKWPAYYPDSVPAAVNIGLGCPTGVRFGTSSNFPAKYKSAFFILDWTFGRILAVHLHPQGSTYTAMNEMPSPYHLTGPLKSADVEEFVRGKGLPVTDVEFGQDGAMYFTIGGRGTQAGLYRVSSLEAAPVSPVAAAPSPAVETRRKLEAEAGSPITDDVWANLGSPDRFLRFAARQRLEYAGTEGVAGWRARALAEATPQAGLNALLALARVGTKEDQEALLKALAKFPLETLSDELKLDKLRVIEVAIARQGRPATDLVQALSTELSKQYPAKTFSLNRELSSLLVMLGAPDVIEKTLGQLESSTDTAEQVWFALVLREATNWKAPEQERYYSWFAKARTYHGGNSFGKFILRIRDEALEKVSATDRPALQALAEKEIEKPKPTQPMPARSFVKAWTLDELVPVLDEVGKGRDFERGKKLFTDVMCAQCHLFAGGGGTAKNGAVGPDLTAVGNRFSRKDILEAILDPSKAISEQYASFNFTMKDGTMAAGQIAEENHYLLTLIVDPISGERQNFPKAKVDKREMSTVSLMPPGLLYTLSKEEVFDLLAFLESGGNADAPNFKK